MGAGFYTLRGTGQVTKSLTEHSSYAKSLVTELYTHDYDQAGRLLKTRYKFNNNPEIALSDMTAAGSYDELGRLAARKRHGGADTESFAYNIRNWPTRITSGTSAFEENLYYTQSVSPTANGCYNGNIAQTTWKYNGTLNNYKYSYDALNRLSSAILFANNTFGPRYSETFTHDKMGNVKTLTRFGGSTSSPIDYLTMTYNGNQVTRIDDPLGSQNSYTVKEYQNKSNAANEMAYDANGNMVKDLDRGIVTIKYNVLNLPDIVQFKNGNQIKNLYDASGKKLAEEFFTQLTTIAPLTEGQVKDQSYSAGVVDQSGTAYIGNFEYKTSKGNSSLTTLARVYNPEGYVEDYTATSGPLFYHYYRRDHLGNNREVWYANSNVVAQRTQYYPSGLPWASGPTDGPGCQARKYNGKEFVEMHGWDTYDYGARGYYPAIGGGFMSVDPLAEKYYSISPYAYCMGNPVKYIDPDGRAVYLFATRLPMEDGPMKSVISPATHTFIVVRGSDNVNHYYAYGGENGMNGKLMKAEYQQDIQVYTDHANGKTNPNQKAAIEMPIPEGMTSEQFDKKVISTAESFGNNPNVTYVLTGGGETGGNCNTSTSTILSKSGVDEKTLSDTKSNIPGLVWGFGDIKPWTATEQKAAVQKENKILEEANKSIK
ncbi:MAG TPA: RHS repeat-associated core domain-containing protein [Nostocaceae cyanobacterium]|nr:RHS repeat-associated core domain-containing protein [Nostocaceae cyanobacterium]